MTQQDRAPVHPDDLMPRLRYPDLVDPRLLVPPEVRLLPGTVSRLQIRYRDLQGWRPLRLDLHLPARPAADPAPVVVYVHGGSFLAGIPEMGPWRTLPQQGIAVASISYRLAGEAAFPEPVEDVRAALSWVGTHAAEHHLDRQRVALWGSSAGGYLAGLAALTGRRGLGHPIDDLPSLPRLAATVLHYPVTDPARLRADSYHNTPAESAALERVMAAFFRAGPADVPHALSDHVVDAGELPPFLLMHGDTDRRVGLRQSRRLHEALIAAGRRAELAVVPGADHGDPVFESPELVSRVVAFLRSAWSS
jgi:acetyl esterase/lipase